MGGFTGRVYNGGAGIGGGGAGGTSNPGSSGGSGGTVNVILINGNTRAVGGGGGTGSGNGGASTGSPGANGVETVPPVTATGPVVALSGRPDPGYAGYPTNLAATGPSDQTATQGGSTSFTVSASNGATASDGTTRLYFYQWQILSSGIWADIPGATAATLSLPNVQLADDGTQYRCLVNDRTWSNEVITQLATLTVRLAPQRAPSSLPRTGDGFPLYALTALLGVGLAAAVYAGARLRGKKKRG